MSAYPNNHLSYHSTIDSLISDVILRIQRFSVERLFSCISRLNSRWDVIKQYVEFNAQTMYG